MRLFVLVFEGPLLEANLRLAIQLMFDVRRQGSVVALVRTTNTPQAYVPRFLAAAYCLGVLRYAVGVLPPALELLPISVLQDAIEPEHGTQRLPSLGERPIDGLTCLHVHCIAVRILERARRRLLAALHLHAVQRIRWSSERLGGRAGITDHLLRVVPPRVTEQAQAPHGQEAVRPEGGPHAGRPPRVPANL